MAFRIAAIEVDGAPVTKPPSRKTWNNIVAWRHVADQALAEFVKGSKIIVEGRFDYYSYFGPDGQLQILISIVANALFHPDL